MQECPSPGSASSPVERSCDWEVRGSMGAIRSHASAQFLPSLHDTWNRKIASVSLTQYEAHKGRVS
jgi:hypothetical protein